MVSTLVMIASQQTLAKSAAPPLPIEVESIHHFKIGDQSQQRFGQLRFLSGIEYSADDDRLGGISGIRILAGGLRFLAVSDQGMWFSGAIERNADGKIIGLKNAQLAPMLNKKGKPIKSKKKGDAEGLEIIGGQALVSFERKSRIDSYQLDLENHGSSAKSYRKSIRKFSLPNNKGLEAIVVLERNDQTTPKNARIATFSESSRDDQNNIRGFISTKNKWKELSVKAIGDFKVTDATLLPGGDILILERQYSITTGPLIRMRRIAGADIKPGAVLDGPIIFEADGYFEIDNLEGISAWVNAQGQTILTLVSDDNFSFLQRNLMLEFELLPVAD